MVNWKGAIVLVALVVVAGVYLFQTRPLATPSTPSAPAFWGCTAGAAVELTVARASGGSLDLRRSAATAGWAFVGPPTAPAVDATVDRLLTDLTTLAPTDTLPRAAAGVDYGFEPPYLAVGCRVSGGQSFNLSVGKQSFDGSSRYARLAGASKVYVLSGAEVGRLDQFLDQPPYRPSPIPSGPSPSPTT